MLPINMRLFFGFDKTKEPYSTIVTRPPKKFLPIEQVYYTDGFGREKVIHYVSVWRMSFREKLKCFFLGRIFFTILLIPGKYPPEPFVSFKGPEFHELFPFEKGYVEMLKQAEEVENND